MSERKKQVRFTEKDDIILLKDVLARNPFRERNRWTGIAEAVSRGGFSVDSRRDRERTFLLIDQHRAKNAESKKRYCISKLSLKVTGSIK
jgi:hypothetical protein